MFVSLYFVGRLVFSFRSSSWSSVCVCRSSAFFLLFFIECSVCVFFSSVFCAWLLWAIGGCNHGYCPHHLCPFCWTRSSLCFFSYFIFILFIILCIIQFCMHLYDSFPCILLDSIAEICRNRNRKIGSISSIKCWYSFLYYTNMDFIAALNQMWKSVYTFLCERMVFVDFFFTIWNIQFWFYRWTWTNFHHSSLSIRFNRFMHIFILIFIAFVFKNKFLFLFFVDHCLLYVWPLWNWCSFVRSVFLFCSAHCCAGAGAVLVDFLFTALRCLLFWFILSRHWMEPLFFFSLNFCSFTFYYVQVWGTTYWADHKKIITTTKHTERDREKKKKTNHEKKEWWYIGYTIFMFCNTYNIAFYDFFFFYSGKFNDRNEQNNGIKAPLWYYHISHWT